MSDMKSFDEQAATYLSDWSQRLSRRGLLARVGHLALRISGVMVVPLLPVNRVFAQGFVQGCSDWRMCGIVGWFCSNCCGESGSYWSCPSCLNTSPTGWPACCTNNTVCPNYSRTIIYKDCCGDAAGAAACHGPSCHGNPDAQSYCTGGQGSYQCTIIQEGSAC